MQIQFNFFLLLILVIFIMRPLHAELLEDISTEIFSLLEKLKSDKQNFEAVTNVIVQMKRDFPHQYFGYFDPIYSKLHKINTKFKSQQITVSYAAQRLYNIIDRIQVYAREIRELDKKARWELTDIDSQISSLVEAIAEFEKITQNNKEDGADLRRQIGTRIENDSEIFKKLVLTSNVKVCNREDLNREEQRLRELKQAKISLRSKIEAQETLLKIQNSGKDSVISQIIQVREKLTAIQNEKDGLKASLVTSLKSDPPEQPPILNHTSSKVDFHYIFLFDTSIKRTQDGSVEEALKCIEALQEERKDSDDTFSLITFNEDAQILIERQAIRQPLRNLDLRARSVGNNLLLAVQKTGKLLKESELGGSIPVVILLTDSMKFISVAQTPKISEKIGWIQQIWNAFVNAPIIGDLIQGIPYLPYMFGLKSAARKDVISKVENSWEPIQPDEVETICIALKSLYRDFGSGGLLTFVAALSSYDYKNLRQFIKAANGDQTLVKSPQGEYFDFFNQAKITTALPEIFRSLSLSLAPSKQEFKTPSSHGDCEQNEKQSQVRERIVKLEYLGEIFRQDQQRFENERHDAEVQGEVLEAKLKDLKAQMPSETEISALEDQINELKGQCNQEYNKGDEKIKEIIKAFEELGIILESRQKNMEVLLASLEKALSEMKNRIQKIMKQKESWSHQGMEKIVAERLVSIIDGTLLRALMKLKSVTDQSD